VAVTFFGKASAPADNGAQAGPTATVTPPASMTAGDLVVVLQCLRASSITLSVKTTGGQTWTTGTQQNETNNSTAVSWCRFNGTWSTDPQFGPASDTSGLTALMLVFRPTGTSYTWAIDVALASAGYTAPSTPFTVTRTGVNTVKDGAVAVAFFTSVDDNTWGSLSGSGWTQISSAAQIRNTTGQDTSVTAAYQVKATAGATNNVSINQTANGGDAGATYIVAFREVAPGDQAGRETFLGANTTEKLNLGPGRASLANYSRPSLMRGVPIRLYGSFQRQAGPTTAVAGRFAARGAGTAEKRGTNDEAGRVDFRGATTGSSVSGPTYDHAARALAFGASTSAGTKDAAAAGRSLSIGATTTAGTKLADGAGRFAARGATTGAASLNRSVVPFSRPGLLRGIPMRLYGSFQRGSFLGTTSLAGREGFAGAATVTKRGQTDIAGRLGARGVDTVTKRGATAVAGKTRGAGVPASAKRIATAVAGRQIILGLDTVTAIKDGRVIVRYTHPGLDLLLHRTYGSFARTPGAQGLGRFAPRGAATVLHIGRYDHAGLRTSRGAVDAAKRVSVALAGRFAASGAVTPVKIGGTAPAGRAVLRGAVTTFVLSLPTVDPRGRLTFIGTATTARTSFGAVAGRLVTRASTDATKSSGTALAGLLLPRGAMGIGENPQGEAFDTLLFFGATTSTALTQLQRTSIRFFGSVDSRKSFATGDAAGRLALTGATVSGKLVSYDVAGIFRIRGSSTIGGGGVTPPRGPGHKPRPNPPGRPPKSITVRPRQRTTYRF
jgi:hypothetical protein